MVGTLSFTFPFFRHMLCNKKFYHHTLFHVNWWHVSRFFFFFTSENPSRKKVGSVAKVAWKSSDKNMCQLVFLIVKLKKKGDITFQHICFFSHSALFSLSLHPTPTTPSGLTLTNAYLCVFMHVCIYGVNICIHVFTNEK